MVCHTYAKGMMSICLSVTLVDCDHIMQQKVEMGMTGLDGALDTCMEAGQDRNILWSQILRLQVGSPSKSV